MPVTLSLRPLLLADALTSGATGLLLARRPTPARRTVRALVALNALWVVDSLLLLGLLPATAAGTGSVLAQAAVVALLALLQARFPPPARHSYSSGL